MLKWAVIYPNWSENVRCQTVVISSQYSDISSPPPPAVIVNRCIYSTLLICYFVVQRCSYGSLCSHKMTHILYYYIPISVACGYLTIRTKWLPTPQLSLDCYLITTDFGVAHNLIYALLFCGLHSYTLLIISFYTHNLIVESITNCKDSL